MMSLRVLLACTTLAAALAGQTVTAPSVKDPNNFRFLVAGHAYGAHGADNQALHPPLVAGLQSRAFGSIEFLVFTGDVIRRWKPETFALLEKQLEGTRYFIAAGNHDATKFGRDQLTKKYGSLHHRFDIGQARFIILNTQEVSRTIPPEQLAFLRESLNANPKPTSVFVFMHELIWLAKKSAYKRIRANSRSRQAKLKASNYWEDVHPLLVQTAPRPVFVIAGDVAGNADAIPAFHDQRDNVTLIASGMGEVKEENALLVKVINGKPTFELHPMRKQDPKRALEYYSPDQLTSLPRDAFTLPPDNFIRDAIWLGVPILVLGTLLVLRRRR